MNADATLLAGLWSEQGDMVHPDGLIERGRETIRTKRAALFLSREYRGSKHPMTIGNIRCLTSDTAVADGKWELRGVTDASGKLLPPFEGLLTLVMKRTGDWYIEAYRYTQKPATAPMPTWSKRPWYRDVHDRGQTGVRPGSDPGVTPSADADALSDRVAGTSWPDVESPSSHIH